MIKQLSLAVVAVALIIVGVFAVVDVMNETDAEAQAEQAMHEIQVNKVTEEAK